MNPGYKLKYPDFAHPGFFRDGRYSTFKATVSEDHTVSLFGQILVFDAGGNGRGYSALETFNMDSEGRYVSEIMCKRCLELATRWSDPRHRRDPELLPAV